MSESERLIEIEHWLDNNGWKGLDEEDARYLLSKLAAQAAQITALEAEVERLTERLREVGEERDTARAQELIADVLTEKAQATIAPFVALAKIVKEEHLFGHQQAAEYVTGCETCQALIAVQRVMEKEKT